MHQDLSLPDGAAPITGDNPHAARRPWLWRTALLAVLGLALVGATAYGLIGEGPFNWHIAVPATIQGGLEGCVLMLLLGVSQLFHRRAYGLAVCAIAIALYARRHAVDVPLLLILAYVETLIAFGAAFDRRQEPPTTLDYLRRFALGLALWSALAWLQSAAGYGNIPALRLQTLLCAVIGFAFRPRLLVVHLVSRLATLPASARVAAGVLVGWVTILGARTAYVIGYDSLWYGLRGEYVLVGAGSAFKPTGLVSPVYYFPKLNEMLLLPFSGLGNSVLLIGLSVAMLALLALAGNELLKRIGVRDPFGRMLGVGAFLTLPAVANAALESKPDVLASLLFVLAVVHAWDFVARRQAGSLLWCAGLLLLSSQAKLTSVPYAAALVVGLGLAWWRSPRSADGSVAAPMRGGLFLGCAIVVAALITARTWLLTGMPTIGPDALFKLWTMLGFELHEPAGTLHWTYPQNWSDLPELYRDLLWRPQRLPHIIITWTGNVWLWLMACALLWRGAPTSPVAPEVRLRRYLVLPICLTGVLLVSAVAYAERGSDGNYFISALVPAILWCVAAAWQAVPKGSARAALAIGIAAHCAFQAGYSFVSGNWTPGTRGWDVTLGRGFHSYRRHSFEYLNYAGLERIPAYLKTQGRRTHAVGDVPDDVGMRIPGIFECIALITYSRQEYILSPEAFMRFVAIAHVDYVVWPIGADGKVPDAHYPAVAEAIRRFGKPVLVDTGYVLYAMPQTEEPAR